MLNLTKSEVLWEAVYRGLYGAPERDTSVHQKEVNEASTWIERVKIRKTRPLMPLYGYHHMPPHSRPALPPSYTPATHPALPQVAGGPAFPYPIHLGGPYTPVQHVPRTRPAPPTPLLLALPFHFGVQSRSLLFHLNWQWPREGNTLVAVLCNEHLEVNRRLQ